MLVFVQSEIKSHPYSIVTIVNKLSDDLLLIIFLQLSKAMIGYFVKTGIH